MATNHIAQLLPVAALAGVLEGLGPSVAMYTGGSTCGIWSQEGCQSILADLGRDRAFHPGILC